MLNSVPTFTPHQIRRLAVAAEAHPRTAERFLRGESVRGTARDRLARAARELGFASVQIETREDHAA
jgi:hypothetical protein